MYPTINDSDVVHAVDSQISFGGQLGVKYPFSKGRIFFLEILTQYGHGVKTTDLSFSIIVGHVLNFKGPL
jgi:hypothetical protein